MNIQPPGLQNISQWRRQNLAPAPLGVIGNLRASAEQGGTARARRSGIRGLARDSWVNLRFRLSSATPDERRQRAARIEVYDNSRRIGNFLGSLTGSLRKNKDQLRIKEGLEQLSMMVTRDLSDLSGGEYALFTYMNELTRADLEAMHDGLLGHPTARAALLNQISPDLRVQADNVLQQIKATLTQRLTQVAMVEPLWQIRSLMLVQPVSEQELAAQLLYLSTGLGRSDLNELENGTTTFAMLDAYFRSLPPGQLQTFSLVFRPPTLNRTQDALGRIVNQSEREQALATLDSIHRSLGREINSRFTRDLGRADSALSQAVSTGNKLDVSKALYDLHLLVGMIKLSYGWLPRQVIQDVRTAVGASLPVFRNTARNPHGPLNAASLQALEDDVLLNLRAATCLHDLGLNLERNALNKVGLSRVYKCCGQFCEESSKDLPEQELNSIRQEKVSEAERALGLIDIGEKRREAEVMLQLMRSVTRK